MWLLELQSLLILITVTHEGREKLQFRLEIGRWFWVVQVGSVSSYKLLKWKNPRKGMAPERPRLDFKGGRRKPCQEMQMILDAESPPQPPDSKEIGSPNTRKQI